MVGDFFKRFVSTKYAIEGKKDASKDVSKHHQNPFSTPLIQHPVNN